MKALALGVFDELDRMGRELDRVMSFGGRPGRRSPGSRVSFHPGRTARSWPLINISEDSDSILVEALAPGVDPASLEVSMTGDQLSISGKRKALPEDVSREKIRRRERPGGSFSRTLTIGSEVDGGKIEAGYKNGLLKITLPKAEAAKPKKIQVNVA